MIPQNVTKKITLRFMYYVIYKALCFDVAQGRMNGAPNERLMYYE